MDILMGLLKPSKGEVIIDGVNINVKMVDENHAVAYYGQSKEEIIAAENAYPAQGPRVFNPQQQIPLVWPKNESG